MEKAFLQYLQSLAQSGIQELPKGNEQLQTQISQSVSATEEWWASHINSDSNASGSVAEENPPQAQESAQPIASVERVDPSAMNQPETVVAGSHTEQAPHPVESNGLAPEEKLKILNEKVRDCQLCPELVENRTQTVFGVGSASARLCFLGEAPGADEDRQGEPFVGAAGQLLTRIIQACKMSREEVYILNTLKCRPPNNRNPTTEECERCSPFLEQQLRVIQPEFICCLGGIAAKHLLDTQLSVGRLRGKWHLYEGIKVMVTYHPAYLLRNPDAKRQVWDDMKFLMNEMGHDYA